MTEFSRTRNVLRLLHHRPSKRLSFNCGKEWFSWQTKATDLTARAANSDNDAGFRWADIGRILGISGRTLRRRRHESGLPVGVGENFSDVSNDDLDEYVREILEVTLSAGQRLVEGGLRKRGFRIQCHRIQESIRRVDPVLRTLRAAQQIIRRVNSVPCPNALW